LAGLMKAPWPGRVGRVNQARCKSVINNVSRGVRRKSAPDAVNDPVNAANTSNSPGGASIADPANKKFINLSKEPPRS
jgi:hypothetical protein